MPAAELHALSQRIQTPLYRLQEVASFFPHFRLQPPPQTEIHVCHDMACHMRGAAGIKAELEKLPEARESGKLGVKFASCLGRCDRAPAVSVDDHIFVGRSAQELAGIARNCLQGHAPHGDSDAALPRQSPQDWQIDIYQGKPAYSAVLQFLEHGDADRIIEAIKEADLRGMGGAGTPTFRNGTTC